jgi:hypothetical protein
MKQSRINMFSFRDIFGSAVIVAIFLVLPVSSFAQEVETVEHTFTVETPPPPTADELEKIANLSEKYIKGQITSEEMIELQTAKADMTDLDAYRYQYVQGKKVGTTEAQTPSQPSVTPVPDSSQATPQIIPQWLLVVLLCNAALMILIALLLLSQARQARLQSQL